jgi:protein-tyrosine phosphatase
MTSILVVCTGNVCRSPMAEGLLRNALAARFADEAPTVSSAGTAGWEGKPAMPEAVRAAAERGAEIADHTARALTEEMVEPADLVLAMATEHRDAIAEIDPRGTDRTFTLKELVRLLESFPERRGGEPGSIGERVAEADAARRGGFEGNPLDQDVADPLGLPIESYRAIAWELDEWVRRLVDGLFGAEAGAASGASPRSGSS